MYINGISKLPFFAYDAIAACHSTAACITERKESAIVVLQENASSLF
jgi:hypothetical protein